MTALAGTVRSFEAGSLTITISGPMRVVLNISLTDPLDKQHFSIDVALIEAAASPVSAKRWEFGREPPRPERDADVYGENGEKTPISSCSSPRARFARRAS